ncbi:hypothetical protein LAZ40_04305 [Cereibacter sphaeroides]|uniref:hypothetical protein n=1 Tax=Cereibacter sphaeroides TaxID=1063 RepID=UPI001F22AA13|nr:hypothetical protein [Cereibacter sphaeroides]MCE6958277.1 hypothetical protein [Cereibacter sphaeroides]MCE6971340.1 hypothetical protein [Cereibacter sphaeroides]
MRHITITDLAKSPAEALVLADREPVGIEAPDGLRFVLVRVDTWREMLEKQGSRRVLRMDDPDQLAEIEAIMSADPDHEKGVSRDEQAE